MFASEAGVLPKSIVKGRSVGKEAPVKLNKKASPPPKEKQVAVKPF
jgi:hypothetical protein